MNQVRRWTPDSEGVMCEDSRDMRFATVGRDSYVLAYDYDMVCAEYAHEIEQLRAEIRRLIKECDAAYQIINDMP